MGRVTITEPSVGDSLTVTDINATLTSFNTEASDVDGENVHDQALDNFNFEAEAVTESLLRIKRTSDVFEYRAVSTNSTGFYGLATSSIVVSANQNVDFDNNAHIARVSMGVVAKLPNNVSFSSGNGPELRIKFFLSYKSSVTNLQYKVLPATTREIKLTGSGADDQIEPFYLLQSVSLAHHLNRSITGTHADFVLRLNIQPQQGLVSGALGNDFTEYVQIRGLNFYVDTIKR
jgi:hypothetical protein